MGLFIYRVENRPVGEQGRAFRSEFVNLPSVSLHLPECNLKGQLFQKSTRVFQSVFRTRFERKNSRDISLTTEIPL